MYPADIGTFGTSQKYFGSYVDDWLENTFCNALSTKVNNAIIPQKITQYSYMTMSGSSYGCSYADYSTKKAIATATRHFYLLDIEDIEVYFNYKLNNNGLKQVFPTNKNKTYLTDNNSWLRSASSSYSGSVWNVSGYYGVVYNYYYDYSSAVRPAFTIDLSKITPKIGLNTSLSFSSIWVKEKLKSAYPWLIEDIFEELEKDINIGAPGTVFGLSEARKASSAALLDLLEKHKAELPHESPRVFLVMLLMAIGYKAYKVTSENGTKLASPKIFFGENSKEIQDAMQDNGMSGRFI